MDSPGVWPRRDRRRASPARSSGRCRSCGRDARCPPRRRSPGTVVGLASSVSGWRTWVCEVESKRTGSRRESCRARACASRLTRRLKRRELALDREVLRSTASGNQSSGRNNFRSITSAMARWPRSFGCTWSPLSYSGRRRVGWAGSRNTLSKSMTPSYTPLVRMNRLTS